MEFVHDPPTRPVSVSTSEARAGRAGCLEDIDVGNPRFLQELGNTTELGTLELCEDRAALLSDCHIAVVMQTSWDKV